MTYFSAHPDYGACGRYRRAGHEEAIRYYLEELGTITPRIAALVAAARAANGEIIFTRVQSGTPDGRDTSIHQKHLGLHVPPGSREAEILPDVGRIETDAVVTKAGWGSFYGTNLDPLLRNIGAETLVVCGVTTDGCVEATVREAADRGYRVGLVEDACATSSRAAHDATLAAVGSRHTYVTGTARVLERLRDLVREREGAR
jgi:ureidoacrylate peracid hydrolase